MKINLITVCTDNYDTEYARKIITRFKQVSAFDVCKVEEQLVTFGVGTEKIKLLQLSINYIIPKALEKNVEVQQPIQSIVWMPASEIKR